MQYNQTKNQKKAVVLLSGGQDSTTCLFWAIKNFSSVVAVGFNYGQRHSKELTCAREICVEAGIELKIFDLPLLGQITKSALTDSNIKPDAIDENIGEPNTLVENRNMLFLTYAATYAKSIGAFDLVTGVSQADCSGYPDCRERFIKSLEITLSLSMDCAINIHTPLMHLSKAKVWKLAKVLGALDVVRFKTLTCYNGQISEGCGACKACSLRDAGFKEFMRLETSE